MVGILRALFSVLTRPGEEEEEPHRQWRRRREKVELLKGIRSLYYPILLAFTLFIRPNKENNAELKLAVKGEAEDVSETNLQSKRSE